MNLLTVFCLTIYLQEDIKKKKRKKQNKKNLSTSWFSNGRKKKVGLI